jgi:hypothetical protein
MVFVKITDSVCGLVGSLCNVTAGLPFDVVKARLQVDSAHPQPHYTGIFDCVRKTGRRGIFGFYRGFAPAFASAAIENSVLFTSNAALRRIAQSMLSESCDDSDSTRTPPALSLQTLALIGGASGAVSAFAICPAEVVKIRLQVQKLSAMPRYTGALQCAQSIVANDGVSGLFKGLKPLLMRDVPYNFVQFGAYETYLHVWRTHLAPDAVTDAVISGGGVDVTRDAAMAPFLHFITGGLAGATAWGVVFPADVLKSKMQASDRLAAAGVAHTLLAMLHNGGVRSLYNGYLVAVARAFPANGSLFIGVELTRRMFDSTFM